MSIYLWGCVWAVSHRLQANSTITSNCIDERRTMELNHAISQPIQVHHQSHVLRCLTSTNPRSQAQFFPKFQHPNKSNNDAHQHTPIPFFADESYSRFQWHWCPGRRGTRSLAKVCFYYCYLPLNYLDRIMVPPERWRGDRHKSWCFEQQCAPSPSSKAAN